MGWRNLKLSAFKLSPSRRTPSDLGKKINQVLYTSKMVYFGDLVSGIQWNLGHVWEDLRYMVYIHKWACRVVNSLKVWSAQWKGWLIMQGVLFQLSSLLTSMIACWHFFFLSCFHTILMWIIAKNSLLSKLTLAKSPISEHVDWVFIEVK